VVGPQIGYAESGEMLKQFSKRIWMKTPRYADFPRSEYEKRIEKARNLMNKKGVDLLVIWDPDNLRYFTGFVCTHWDAKSIQSAVYILPRKGEPVLILPYLFRAKAEADTYVNIIRTQDHAHSYQKMREFPCEVADTIIDLGYGEKSIGIEAGLLGGMYIPRPLNDIERFKNKLRGANFLEAADIIWECRMIKSEAEIVMIKEACNIAMVAYQKLLDKFELGWKLRDIGSFLEKACVDMKGEDFKSVSFSATKNVAMFDHPHYYDVPINKGDRVSIEFGIRYKGYRGGLARSLQIGPFREEQKKLDEAVTRAQKRAVDAVKPGIMAKEIIEAANHELKVRGFKPNIDMVGHGFGLTPHEPPMLEAMNEMRLKEGMTLAVEVWQIEAVSAGFGLSNLGVFGNEDLVVVTKEGCEELTFGSDMRNIPT